MARKTTRVFPHLGGLGLHVGDMEIWDGADLALLRDSLTHMIRVDKCRGISIDMRYVKYIPSGFFGMLFDWHEEGVTMRLIDPQPNVRQMLWFTRFFQPVAEMSFELRPERYTAPQPPAFQSTTQVPAEWNAPARAASVTTMSSR